MPWRAAHSTGFLEFTKDAIYCIDKRVQRAWVEVKDELGNRIALSELKTIAGRLRFGPNVPELPPQRKYNRNAWWPARFKPVRLKLPRFRGQRTICVRGVHDVEEQRSLSA
jgi:hypothetical protein